MDELIEDRGLRIADSEENNPPAQTSGKIEPDGHIQSAIRNPQSAIGVLLALVGLAWVLHDFQLARLREMIGHLEYRWIALAVVCDVMSYLCQGARWRLLLLPVGDVSTLRATQAVYAGLFTNEILPMRLGELVRAYLVARWTAVKFVAVLPSLLVERFFDSLWLVVGIGLTAMFVPLPKDLLRAADALGVIVLAAAGIMAYFVLRPPDVNRFRARPLRLFSSLLAELSAGLQGMTRTRAFYLSMGGSLLLLAFQAAAYWLVMLGCGLRLSFWTGLAVFLIVHLGTAIPNAPANIGSYQFFTVLGLTLFGVDKAAATSFSLVVFLLLTLPLLLLGFVAISASGTTWMNIRGELQSLRASET